MSWVIMISPNAYRGILASAYTEPNSKTKCRPKIIGPEDVSLESIKGDFTEGPDTFLAAYAITHHTHHLGMVDVAAAYCLDHINMVRVHEQIFCESGRSHPHFAQFIKRRFKLNKYTLPVFLYSCLGKPGRIIDVKNGIADVQTDHCLLKGVVVPSWVTGSVVVVHSATATLSISEEEAKEINCNQTKHAWVAELTKTMPDIIDYSKFFGRNLTQYAKMRLRAVR